MEIKNDIKLAGKVNYEMFDASGKLESTWKNENLVVTAGKNALAAWLAAASQVAPFMPYTALGEGAVAPIVSDTALGSEISRIANTPTSTLNVLTFTATFNPGVGTSTGITEAGLFSTSSLGDMFSRQTFAAQPKAAGSTLVCTWSITIS